MGYTTMQMTRKSERAKLAPKSNELTAFKAVVKQRDFPDLIVMIKAYLMSGNLEHAESLLSQVKLTHLSEWWSFSNGENGSESSGLLNMFVQAYLEQDQPAKALEHIRSQPKQKNSLTFGLLLKHYLAKDDMEKCRGTLREMRMGGFLVSANVWEHLLRTRVLKRAELDRLIPLIYSLDGNSEEISIDLDEIDELFEPVTVDNVHDQLLPSFDLNEIRPVESNSHGIDFIKKALSSLKQAYEENRDGRIDKYALQEKLERDCSDAAAEQFRMALKQFLDLSKSPNLTRVKRMMCEWHPILTNHFKSLIDVATSLSEPSSGAVEGNKLLYAALLTSLQAEKISIIAMQELTRISALDVRFDGVPLARIATNIGACLEREVFAQQIFKKDFLAYVRLSPKQRNQILHNRRAFTRLMEKTRQVLDDSIEARQAGWIPSWSTSLKAEVGTFVANEAIKLLRYTAKEGDVEEPAFSHELVSMDRKRFGVVKYHPKLFATLTTEPEFFSVDPTAMPMVVPPNPWLSYNQGGYLTQKQICVRLKEDPVHLSILHEANANRKMDSLLHGLDILGQTAWLINERVLRVAIELWNSGVNVSTHERAPPERLFEYRTPESFEKREEYIDYVATRANHLQEKGKAHSTMCDTNYKLEIARQFSGVPFYLPHSVDFRGRAYPIPPHLSHIGSDLSRGLLVFAEGKPLGERGLFWLKVQLANMFGFDKYALVDRAKFSEEHLEDILDSARNPIRGKQWWLKADEPWQCLAACMELDAVLSSGMKPEEYISHFPVQQDGSCNGLQHYAALGRDVGGASKVNLSPSEKPQDIYAAVANLVNEKIESDCAKGVPIALKLRNKINRKIIKQPVMTNVYGVTPFGARAQIQERLKEYNVVGKEDYLEARKYLCDEVFNSLRTLFVKARLIQDWLTDAAQEISRAIPVEVATSFGYRPELEVEGKTSAERYRTPVLPENSTVDEFTARYPQTSVSWDTPLGFRVVQPYLKSRTVLLKTVMQTLSLKTTNKLDPVDIGKQVSAFPPNFVHSLDASHMFMTAVACFQARITFASVHDCFWTHASTVDQMNEKIREQFVELYSQPVLARLREDFVKHYGSYKVPIKVPAENTKVLGPDEIVDSDSNPDISGKAKKYVARWRHINLPPVPEQGDFDISQVLKSQYFFS